MDFFIFLFFISLANNMTIIKKTYNTKEINNINMNTFITATIKAFEIINADKKSRLREIIKLKKNKRINRGDYILNVKANDMKYLK